LNCRHVCKTCAFHDALQAGKQKEVHPPYSPDQVPAGARSGAYGGWASLCFVCFLVPFTERFRHTTLNVAPIGKHQTYKNVRRNSKFKQSEDSVW
jgi:hypothetical protein